MKAFALFAALAMLACSPQKKVDRVIIPDTVIDDQCGDSMPGCPRDTLQGNDTVKMQIDSGAAFLWHRASYGASVAVDSSIYKIRWRVSGFTAGDTVQIRLTRDSVTGKVGKVSITKSRFTINDSVSIGVDKIYGAQANYAACVRLRRTTVKSEICQLWATNFAAPGKVDTMSVDSSQAMAFVRAAYADWPNKMPVQYCLYLKTKDDKMRIIAGQENVSICQKLYRHFPATQQFPDYRAFVPKEGHYSITIDQAKKVIIIDFVRQQVPFNPLVGHPT